VQCWAGFLFARNISPLTQRRANRHLALVKHTTVNSVRLHRLKASPAEAKQELVDILQKYRTAGWRFIQLGIMPIGRGCFGGFAHFSQTRIDA
jgi:hypothetical protein